MVARMLGRQERREEMACILGLSEVTITRDVEILRQMWLDR